MFSPAEPILSAEQAFCAIAGDCARDLDRYLAEFMETPSPEGPHKARVALRRLTTALDAFQPLLRAPGSKALRRQAKDIFHRLGPVRDADVYHSAKATTDTPPEIDGLRETVRAALRRRMALEFGPLLLRRLSDGTLLRDGETGRRLRSGSVLALANTAMDKAFAAVRSHGKSLARMDDAARHEFRKDLKSLRYLTNFFVDPGTHKTLFNDLETLQDLLGTLNDLANARLREKKSRRRRRVQLAALKQADGIWRRLRHAAPWWRAASA